MPRPLITILLLLLVTACQKKAPIEPTLSLAKTRVDVAYNIDTVTCVVRTNNIWTATSQDSWCTVLENPNDSTLKIAITANTNTQMRKGTVMVTAANLGAVLVIQQGVVPGGDYYRHEDSLAMIAIYDACAGSDWRTLEDEKLVPTWEPDKPITTWRGVTTSIINHSVRVSSISLIDAGVKGSLPPQINRLSELNALYLGGNSELSSPLEVLSGQPKLEILDLSYASYKIDMPRSLGTLVGLVFLTLDGADLSQAWLYDLAQLTKIQYLSIVGCNISKGLPVVIRKLGTLHGLNISGNPLAGEIPSWIGSLRNLQELDISGCGLSGVIPATIGDLTQLIVLKAGANALTGNVPPEIGQLHKLEILNLSDCGLSGTIPSSIAQCGELSYLDLSFNDLQGEIPSQLANLTRLTDLALVGNRLSGTIPAALKDGPLWATWWPESLICPQQQGFGFANCTK